MPWIALRSVPEIGDALCRRLIEHFGAPEALRSATMGDIFEVEGFGPERAKAVVDGLRDASLWRRATAELDAVAALGGEVLVLSDPDYPGAIREIPDPPPVLYVLGTLSPTDRFSVAVVGSRDASEYGLRMAARISGDLARKGITVVSGGARGIDAVAHRAALRAGGRTVAVLGCGIDVTYPPENRGLFREIASQGAIVTEFVPGTPPDRGNFPRRNRLISGLSLGVVIVEASRGSGSLITAGAAIDQGREVFAVPGMAGARNSQGTNDLIRRGARLTESADDIVEELHGMLDGMVRTMNLDAPAPPELSPVETRIFQGLDKAGKNVDRIADEMDLDPPAVLRGLLSLEIKGLARQLPGGRFVVQ